MTRTPVVTAPALQHNEEIHRNRQLWRSKPLLRKIYRDFHLLIAAQINPALPGKILELGSGIGAIKEVLPDCITSDLFPNPWLDRQENAYRLDFPDHALSHLILFDVFHHLQYPGSALAEFLRVLHPQGRLILFEPAAGFPGKIVYGGFHPEPLALRDPISWTAPDGFDPSQAPYYAAQGNAWRIFLRKEIPGGLSSWQIKKVLLLPALDYLASGGFTGPQLYPTALHPVLRGLNILLGLFPRISASRMLVVLESAPAPAAP
ncbi:MAG: class I SAM-dependent methyltransferase [Verrucomicrobiae bacterium]|nr:class I SAM-dependent methyltransferase [Verrucomicrobiae bacterium]